MINKRFVVDKKMPFIREPFYNREKTKTKQKIHNRPTKNVIYYRTFLQQRKKDDKQKICGWQKNVIYYRTFLQQRKKDDKQKICGWQKNAIY